MHEPALAASHVVMIEMRAIAVRIERQAAERAQTLLLRKPIIILLFLAIMGVPPCVETLVTPMSSVSLRIFVTTGSSHVNHSTHVNCSCQVLVPIIRKK